MTKLTSILIATASVFALSSCSALISWDEVDGEITGKYIEEGGSSGSGPDHVLTLDAGNVEYVWHVTSGEFAGCEVGNKVHRNSNGNVTCTPAEGE